MLARRAVQAAQLSGVDPRLMRMGKSLDSLSAVQAVMQQETSDVSRESSRRPGLGGLAGRLRAGALRRKRPHDPVAVSAGTIVAVPDSEAARRGAAAGQRDTHRRAGRRWLSDRHPRVG